MDSKKKLQALKEHHQELRTGIIVANILPEFRQMLTDVEYSRIEDKTDNVSAVDELVKTLLTKTDTEFDEFCEILRANRYAHWARKLEESEQQRGDRFVASLNVDVPRTAAKPKPLPEPPITGKPLVTVTPNPSVEQTWDDDELDLLDIQQDLISCDVSVFESWGHRRSREDRYEAIQALYSNAYSALVRILERVCRTTTYLDVLKKRMRNNLRAEKLEQADSLSGFFQSIGIEERWDNLYFLRVAISCLPPIAKREKATARKVYNLYRHHLRAYQRSTSIKDWEVLMKAHEDQDKEAGLVPLEITVTKDIEDYTWEECATMGNRFFGGHVQFCSARPGNSTIIVFMVPKTLAREIEEKLSKPDVVWTMKELGFQRVHAPGMFDKDVTAVISADSIRAGLESGVDFISLTKHCSPLMKSLVNSQDMSLMDEGKYTGEFFRELTKTVPAYTRVFGPGKGMEKPPTQPLRIMRFEREPARGLQKVAAQMGRYSVGAAALVPAVKREPSLSDIQSKEITHGIAMMRAGAGKMYSHPAEAAALVPAAEHEISDIQSKGLHRLEHPLRDWRKLGECQKVIRHSPEGGWYCAVSVNNEGLLAVTDLVNRCVHLLTNNGILARSIGEGVLGGGLFGVSFDLKGNVWVTDMSNNNVVKLSQDGQLLLIIYHVECPCGISVSADGRIYICDHGNHCITVYDEQGRFLFAFGSKGSGPGCFDRPRDIAFGSDGLVYVVDLGNNCVSVWSKEGTFKRYFKPKYQPDCIAATNDNHLLITSSSSHTVMVYTLEGELIHQFRVQGSDPGRINGSWGICVDDNELVYVVYCRNNCVQVF